jgi:hypothetical protein
MADQLRQQILQLLAVEPQTEAIGRQVNFLKEELKTLQQGKKHRHISFAVLT